MVSINHQPLLIELDQKKSFSSSFVNPQLHLISFKFTCESRLFEWVINEDSQTPLRSKKTNLPPIETFAIVTRGQLACREKAHKILSEKLGKWDVEPDELRKLIDQALEKAEEMVGCMPPHHNAVHLTYRVEDLRLCISDEGEKGRVGVVPSIESTIESLEKFIFLLGMHNKLD